MIEVTLHSYEWKLKLYKRQQDKKKHKTPWGKQTVFKLRQFSKITTFLDLIMRNANDNIM